MARRIEPSDDRSRRDDHDDGSAATEGSPRPAADTEPAAAEDTRRPVGDDVAPETRRPVDDTRPVATEGTRRPVDDVAETGKPKTSAASAFALVFGLSALISALTVIGAPLAIVFGLLALILGVVGMGKANREWRITGKGVAASGLVLGVLGLVLGVAVTIGLATFLSDNRAAIEQSLEDLQEGRIPDASDLTN